MRHLFALVLVFQLAQLVFQLFLVHAERLDLSLENVHASRSNDGAGVRHNRLREDLPGMKYSLKEDVTPAP